MAENRTFKALSVRTVDGRYLALEEPGGQHQLGDDPKLLTRNRLDQRYLQYLCLLRTPNALYDQRNDTRARERSRPQKVEAKPGALEYHHP